MIKYIVLCLVMVQISSHDVLVQRWMSWFEAQQFCQRHYIDLAVLSTEEQYFTLLNVTAGSTVSFWLGMRRESVLSGWKWVDGEELNYEHWYRNNVVGRCASLEATLKEDKKLLARYCEELHMFVCQGPVSPLKVMVDSVGSDHVILSWNISPFMQMTPHLYNVTTCTDTCDTLLIPYTDGSAFMKIKISNLTSATEYFIESSASIVRPDSVSGINKTLQSLPAVSIVKTVNSLRQRNVIFIILKVLTLVFLATVFWTLKKNNVLPLGDFTESDHDISPVELSVVDTIADLIP